jgi:hypothetical protein
MLMRPLQYPAIGTFSALIFFFACLDFVRSAEVVIGIDWLRHEQVSEYPINHHPEESESEKETKSGEKEPTESKKKKVLEVDDYDKLRVGRRCVAWLKSEHRLGNSSSRLALAAARIWEPPEVG